MIKTWISQHNQRGTLKAVQRTHNHKTRCHRQTYNIRAATIAKVRHRPCVNCQCHSWRIVKAIYMVCTRRNPDFTLTRIATDRADNADVLENVTCIIIQHNVSMIIWPKKRVRPLCWDCCFADSSARMVHKTNESYVHGRIRSDREIDRITRCCNKVSLARPNQKEGS